MESFDVSALGDGMSGHVAEVERWLREQGMKVDMRVVMLESWSRLTEKEARKDYERRVNGTDKSLDIIDKLGECIADASTTENLESLLKARATHLAAKEAL